MMSKEYTHDLDMDYTHDNLISSQQHFLLLFSQAHSEFRRAEFESVCRICGIQPIPEFSHDQSHLQLVYLGGGDIWVKRILSRAILLKSAYHLLMEATSHETLVDYLKTRPNYFKPFNTSLQSWCFQLRTINRKQSQQYIQSKIQEYASTLKLDHAPVDLNKSKNTFTLFEIFNHRNQGQQLCRVLLTRFIGEGQTCLKVKFSLSKRLYIGNSTMDPELAFIQANLGMVNYGTLIMDPYCGTGGILLTAAHFGGHVLGVEIKWDVARAKGKSSRAGEFWLEEKQSIWANFAQYGLDGRFLGIILADSSQHQIWKTERLTDGVLDAILTDPPYGIRERCQKLGTNEWRYKPKLRATPEATNGIKKSNREFCGYPEKQQYPMFMAFLDLLNMGARLLKLHGRLVFWFPVCKSEYSERILPRSECMQLLYNCEQSLTKDTARRLLVYEKIRHPQIVGEQMLEKAYFEDNCYEQQTFRQKVFNSNNNNRNSKTNEDGCQGGHFT